MITKIEGTKHGYRIDASSTEENFKAILRRHLTERGPVRCIIVNRNTYPRFGTPLLGTSIVTINNHVKDNEFYINSVN